MIAVIYSGSKEAHWKIAQNGTIICSLITQGFNPFFNSVEQTLHFFENKNELITYAEKIKKIYFFGAGASSTDRRYTIHTALKKFFKNSRISIAHDLDAIAKVLATNQEIIVGILGSGANAGYYNGKKLIQNNYGMGYIMADEGSGSHFGKQILKGYLTETMPEDLRKIFYSKYKLDLQQILDHVYKLPNKAAFLNSFTDFAAKNQSHPFIQNMINDSFDQYFKNMILPLVNKHGYMPIHIVGTNAALFESFLIQAAKNNLLEIKSVIKEPIYKILDYYSNKN